MLLAIDYFRKTLYLALLRLFYCGSKTDTLECLIYAKLFVVFTPSSKHFPPYSEVIHGNTKLKLIKV